MIDAECFLCDRHIFDAEDLVEHFKTWHSSEFRNTHIVLLAGMCIKGLRDAIEEKVDDSDDEDSTHSLDVFDGINAAKSIFDGFSGGKFSGGGANSKW